MAKFALLIGVSEYEPGLNPLPAAVKDLDAMREVLLHPDMGGFAESDVELLKNPVRQAMEERIETLFANRNKDDLVLLFFSGHGIKDDAGRLYLASSTTRKTPQGDLMRSSAVSAIHVHENMNRSRSKRQVVILDSCFSGAFAEGLSAKDDGTVDILTQLGGEGRAILTSSSSTQYSFEQEGEELSLYTRFLIEGIKTGAADQDGDDVVSIDELHKYVSQKVREVKPEVKPEIYAIREGYKIQLCKVPQGNPHERYKKEVARYGKRGELTIVSRSILKTWRLKLGLSADAAKKLEDEVLEPYRRDFQQKLRQYEQTVTDVLQRDSSINDNTRQELQQLQQVLGLRNEDTILIEECLTANLETEKQKHLKHLQQYERTFSDSIQIQFPVDEVTRRELGCLQELLGLGDEEVRQIEEKVSSFRSIPSVPGSEGSENKVPSPEVEPGLSSSSIPLQPYQYRSVRVDEQGEVTPYQANSPGGKYVEKGLKLPSGAVPLEMVVIPAGTFTMGSPDNEAKRLSREGPQRQVRVKPFLMGRYEVTQAQYEGVMGTNPTTGEAYLWNGKEWVIGQIPSKFLGENKPVIGVSWDDAKEFIRRLNEKTGKRYRLPTEAEWEYGARAGTTTPFSYGATITPEVANYDGNYPY
ncbi:MAG: SUMF1/EgtB/PvdO family nonheme iron enzyme, partial [Cyanobacteria bacterium REEB444]|nr:SUMF1/EgtB/PvdO family nonheme iron enzyme [Cyanobacteria bacterium REEB444]